MFSVNPEIYTPLSLASRWLFVFFALMLLVFALVWHHVDRKERRDRFRNLPGAGTVGELVVLSGSDELAQGTWFPVPREGVLGSLRSCDLVVSCPGVRSHHLDFSWQDGTGLLIRPRIGCEVLVDGIPVSRRGNCADVPLLHGSMLQVGSAVLRLQLFAALSHTNRIFTSQQSASVSEPDGCMPPVQPPVQDPHAATHLWQVPPEQEYFAVQPLSPSAEQAPQPQNLPDQARQQSARRRGQADDWKEDWSE